MGFFLPRLGGFVAGWLLCAGLETSAQPALRLRSLEPGVARWSWLAAQAGGFLVERAPTLNSMTWTGGNGPLGTMEILGDEVRMTTARSGGETEFFRLRSVRTEEPVFLLVNPAGSGAVDPSLVAGLPVGAVVVPGTNLAEVLAAVPPGGATVLLGEGVFTGNFTLPGNVTLRGRGRDRTVLRTSDPTRLPTVSAPVCNVVIEDLTLDGQRRNYTAGVAEFYSINGVLDVMGTNVTVRRVRVTDAMGNGIYVQSSSEFFRLEESEVINSATNNTPAGTPGGHGYGVFVSSAKNPVLRSNLVTGWAQGVGLWYGVTNALVEGNQIVSNFGFIDAAHTINRSACEDYGADVIPHGWNLWRSNLVDGSTSHCLEIAQGVAGSRFIGNVLRRPGQISDYGQHWEVTGQVGVPTSDIWIEGNDIVSDGLRADSCSVNGLASRVTITNNTFSGFAHPASNGPLFLGGLSGVRDVTIVGNRFADSRFGVSINIDTTDFLIAGNRFTNPQPSAAVLHVATTGSGRIADNLLAGTNFVTGIKLIGTGGNVVMGNTVTLPAPALNCQSADNVISNNVFTETIASLAGTLRLEGTGALRNLVTGNRVGSPDSRAILLLAGAAQNTVTNNIITAGYVEVHPTAGPGNLVTGN